MADEDFGRRIPFAFLEDIKNRFKTAYGTKGKTAMAYAMNDEFSKVLKRQMVIIHISFQRKKNNHIMNFKTHFFIDRIIIHIIQMQID